MADQSPDYGKKGGSKDAGKRLPDERLPDERLSGERLSGERSLEEHLREDRRHGDRRHGDRRQRDRRQEDRQPENNARQHNNSRFWYDFMRFNLTGWSVVIPTLVGLALGNWIDQRNPGGFSWTLTLMAAGLFLGCLNAWYWIRHHDHNGRNK